MKVKYVEKFTREGVEKDSDFIYLFGDNIADLVSGHVPNYTQAVIRGLPNALGICTKRDRYKNEDSYLNDGDYGWFTVHVDTQIRDAMNSGKGIAIPSNGIGTGMAMLESKAPKCFMYLKSKLDGLAVWQ